MTLPQGAAGVDTTNGFFLTSGPASTGDQTAADLVDNTQDKVVATFKAKKITNGTSVFSNPTGVLSQVFGGLAGIPGLVFSFAGKILAAFGTLASDFESIPDALNRVAQTLNPVLKFVGNLAEMIEGDFSDLLGRVASLESAANELNPVTDNAANTTNLVAVSGTVSPTGWGAWTAAATAVALYNSSPATDRQGAGIIVKAKKIGQTRLHICSDTAMTNWVALELNVNAGVDTIAVVTGTGPTSGVVTRTSLAQEIPDNSFWEIRYEPYDDDVDNSNTFHVFLNGTEVPLLRWPDAGNVSMHGADQLNVGVTLNGLSDASHRGFVITKFQFYNWLTASPQ